MITFKTIIQDLEQFSIDHYQLNSFFFGTESLTHEDFIYPILKVEPTYSNITNMVGQYSFDIVILDLIEQDGSINLDIANETLLIGRDVIAQYFEDNDGIGFELISDDIKGVYEEGVYDDLLAGWRFSITLHAQLSLSTCLTPAPSPISECCSLARTLSVGNTTTGSDIIISAGDELTFVNTAMGGYNKIYANGTNQIAFKDFEDSPIGIDIGYITFQNDNYANLIPATLTEDRSYLLPDASGTLLLDGQLNSIFTEITDGHLEYEGNTLVYTSDLTEFLSNPVDYITYNNSYVITGSEPVGTRYWNNDDETTNLVLPNGVILQDGQEVHYNIKNSTGSDLTNGKVVSYAGTDGNSGHLKGEYGIASASSSAFLNLGIATETITNGEFGKVTHFGAIRGIQTNGANYGETWNDADILYVSGVTPGALTNIMPNAPTPAIPFAVVINAHVSNGTLFVRPSYPEALVNLSDVNGSPLTASGQILVWDDSSQYFDFTENINDYLLDGVLNSIFTEISDGHLEYSGNTLAYLSDVGGSSLTESQVAFGSATNEITSSSDFTFDGSTLSVPSVNIEQYESYKQNNVNILRTPTASQTSLCVGDSGNDTFTGTLNITMGSNAGANLTTSEVCIGIGDHSLGGSAAATTGNYNNAIGYYALSQLTSGQANIAIGPSTGFNITTGSNNVILGNSAGYAGNFSDAIIIGSTAGFNNTGTLNMFIGGAAGYNNTSGGYNIAMGYQSLYNCETGYYNVGIGMGSLYSMVSKWGSVAIGKDAGYTSNSNNNVFIGYRAGYNEKTTSGGQLMIGQGAGYNHTTGSGACYIGNNAGATNTTGALNTFVGSTAGYYNNTASYNTYIGYQSGFFRTGADNTCIGKQAGSGLLGYTTGIRNVFIGVKAGYKSKNGSSNIAIGYNAMSTGEVAGSLNIVIGQQSGYYISSGQMNILIGSNAGLNITTGFANTILGTNAGLNIGGANYNVFIGYQAGYNETGSNKLIIGNSTTSELIYGDFSTEEVTINGSLETTGSRKKSITPVAAATYTLLSDDNFLHVTVTCTITLPTALTTDGRMVNIKNTSTTDTLTIVTGGSETIDNETTQTIYPMQMLKLYAYDGNWWVA